MERLHFTTRVLGLLASYRLEKYEVTQTLRSHTSDIVQAILTGRIKIGDRIPIILDENVVGFAEYTYMDLVGLDNLTINDAHRGGFDSISELAITLKRAGYRFKSIDKYRFYRIQFQWLVEA